MAEVFVDKRGRQYPNGTGRPRTGRFTVCMGFNCNTKLYITKSKDGRNPDGLDLCQYCYRKLYPPPVLLFGSRWQKGGLICPKCQGHHCYWDEDDYGWDLKCLTCGQILARKNKPDPKCDAEGKLDKVLAL